MNLKECVEKSKEGFDKALSDDRVRQYCKFFNVDINNITEQDFLMLQARRHRPKVVR